MMEDDVVEHETTPGWRGMWDVMQSGMFYVVIAADAASLVLLGHEGGFQHGHHAVLGGDAYNHPGSAIWDILFVGIVRLLLLVVTGAMFDLGYRSWRMRRRSLRSQSDLRSSGSDGSERFTRRLSAAACTLSVLFVMAKLLVRLIMGIGEDDDSMLWFWLAASLGLALPVLEYTTFCMHLSSSRRGVPHHDDVEGGCKGLQDPLLAEEGMNASHQGTRGAEKAGKGGGKTRNASIRDLLSLVKGDWVLIWLAFVFLLGAALCQVMIPHYTGKIMDSIVDNRGPKDFQSNTVMLVVFAVLCGVCTGLRGSIFTIVGARVNRRIRIMLFSSLMRQEIGFYDTTKTGELSSRLNADTTKVGDQVSLNVNFFLRNLVQAVGTLIFMFYVSWKLSFVAFVSVPAIVLISKIYGEYIRKLSVATQQKLAEASSIAEEALSSMTTIRSFACERGEERLYAEKLNEYYDLSKKEGRAYGFYACGTVMLPQMVTAVVLYYGGQLVLAHDGLTSGQLVSFLLYLSSLSDAFNNLGSIFSSLTQALGAADKVFELIRWKPKTSRSDLSLQPATCQGDVQLKDVVFRYPARPARVILDRLSLTAKPGQVVALVGPSGGGKSSCVALIEHFYEPEKGDVLLDGRPVRDYDRFWFHRSVSIVGQEPTLYARSIRRNIIFGLEGGPHEPTDEEIRHAAVLANAHDFIESLPQGYDTEVGERGVCLSGGQKQRIAIARALCRNPSVLLLDEATSALDAESEAQVQRAIDNMITQCRMTVIVIAHRLSTIINADKILVIQGGQVVEEGLHRDLIAKGTVYAQLVARQLDRSVLDVSQVQSS